jgi:hypothetical protein
MIVNGNFKFAFHKSNFLQKLAKFVAIGFTELYYAVFGMAIFRHRWKVLCEGVFASLPAKCQMPIVGTQSKTTDEIFVKFLCLSLELKFLVGEFFQFFTPA